MDRILKSDSLLKSILFSFCALFCFTLAIGLVLLSWSKFRDGNIDYVKDIALHLGTVGVVCLGCVCLGGKIGEKSFFVLSGLWGLLGIISSLFLWHVGISQDPLIERNLLNRLMFLCFSVCMLGWCIILFSEDYGKKIIISAMSLLCFSSIFVCISTSQFYKLLLVPIGFWFTYLAYLNISFLFVYFVAFFWLHNLVVFVKQGYVTWYIALDPAGGRGNFMDIIELTPENYIFLAKEPSSFWWIIGTHLLPCLVLMIFLTKMILKDVSNQLKTQDSLEE